MCRSADLGSTRPTECAPRFVGMQRPMRATISPASVAPSRHCPDAQASNMTKRFILVAGNIGSGKTSLTERVGARLGYLSAHESVADNPYLADFYGNMNAWSFHLQIYFLGH